MASQQNDRERTVRSQSPKVKRPPLGVAATSPIRGKVEKNSAKSSAKKHVKRLERRIEHYKRNDVELKSHAAMLCAAVVERDALLAGSTAKNTHLKQQNRRLRRWARELTTRLVTAETDTALLRRRYTRVVSSRRGTSNRGSIVTATAGKLEAQLISRLREVEEKLAQVEDAAGAEDLTAPTVATASPLVQQMQQKVVAYERLVEELTARLDAEQARVRQAVATQLNRENTLTSQLKQQMRRAQLEITTLRNDNNTLRKNVTTELQLADLRKARAEALSLSQQLTDTKMNFITLCAKYTRDVGRPPRGYDLKSDLPEFVQRFRQCLVYISSKNTEGTMTGSAQAAKLLEYILISMFDQELKYRGFDRAISSEPNAAGQYAGGQLAVQSATPAAPISTMQPVARPASQSESPPVQSSSKPERQSALPQAPVSTVQPAVPTGVQSSSQPPVKFASASTVQPPVHSRVQSSSQLASQPAPASTLQTAEKSASLPASQPPVQPASASTLQSTAQQYLPTLRNLIQPWPPRPQNQDKHQ